MTVSAKETYFGKIDKVKIFGMEEGATKCQIKLIEVHQLIQ
jgi:hypothetical protein